MKKLLIIAMLLTASLETFSQNTIEVKESTLISIKKDMDKCEAIKLAYQQKSIVLDSVISQNMQMFDKIEMEREKSRELQDQIYKKNKEIFIESQNAKKGWIVPTLFGVIGGMVLGISL